MIKAYRILHIPTASREAYVYTKSNILSEFFRLRPEDEPTTILVINNTFTFVSLGCPNNIEARHYEFDIEEYPIISLTIEELHSLKQCGFCYLDHDDV